MKKRRVIPVIGALAVVTAAAGMSWLASRSPGRALGSPSPDSSASAGPGPVSLALTTSSDVDGAYDPATSREPTAGTNQPRLWQAAGTWWGTLIAGASGELHVARRDPATGHFVDTGTLVDERPRVRAAVSWDGKTLAVLTAGDKPTPPNAMRITTFHLDAAKNRFVIDPDMPVALTAGGVTSATVVRDGSGVLWLAAIANGRLIVRHSLGNDHLWSADRAGAILADPTNVRTVSLLSSGGRTVLAWNKTSDSTLEVAIHADGDPDVQWTSSSTDVEGLDDAPGDLALAAAAGTPDPRILIAFQASATVAGGSLAPGAIVVSRAPDGTWSQALLGRSKDHLRTPVLAVDEAHDVLLAIAGTTDGQIVVKASPLDRVAFESGSGVLLIGAGNQPVAANPTTVTGSVDLTKGLIVLAGDDAAGQYRHGVVTLEVPGGPSPEPSPSSSPGPLPSPSGPPPSGPPPSTPPPATGPTVLRIDTFDAWPVGTHPPAWDLTPQSGGHGSVSTVAVPSGTNHSLRVGTTSAAGSIRTCTFTPRTATDAVTYTALVRIGRAGGSDTTIASVRGPGGEAASLRVTHHGLVAYYAGAVKRTTTTLLRAGVWYRVRVTVELARKTWSWSIATTSGRALASASGIPWRQAEVPAIDTFCVQPGQGAGSNLFLDDLVVVR